MKLYRIEYECDYWNDEVKDFVPTPRYRYVMGHTLNKNVIDLGGRNDVIIYHIAKLVVNHETLRKCWNNIDLLASKEDKNDKHH